MDMIPITIPLDLPAPMWLLKFILIAFFMLHILFINFMIGGTCWTVFFRMLGKEDPFWSRLAKEIGNTVTVHKSVAIVLGVAPLLTISIIYTNFFYAANNIIAPLWLSLIWLISLAFIALYVYKYTWDSPKYSLRFKYFWGILTVVIFLFVPLIFLANINLMLYPDQWKNVYSFWGAIWIPNVIPRYFHFINASFALTGFFAYGYFFIQGKKNPHDHIFYDRASRLGMKWALYATSFQLIFGVLNYSTLPQIADSNLVLSLIIAAVLLAGVAMYLLALNLYTEKKLPPEWIFVTIFIVVALMTTMRHVVRENALREPKKIMANKTALYRARLVSFVNTSSSSADILVTGENLFQDVCSACHAVNEKIVGPSLVDAIVKYKDSREEMIKFIDDPVKINPEYPRMPPTSLSYEEIEKVVDYLLAQEVEKHEQ